MEYLSNIYFVTTKEGYDFFAKEKLLKEALFTKAEIEYKNNHVIVCWRNCDWDETNAYRPEYLFFHALQLLKEKKIPFHYIRLGQGSGDIDAISYPWEVIIKDYYSDRETAKPAG